MTTNKHKRFMKRIYLPFCIAVICCMLCACSTNQKVIVSGTPGTTIYTPSMKKLGTIGNEGKAQISVTKENYTPFLLSQQNGSDHLVPFALDFERKSSNLYFASSYLSCGIFAGGLGTFVVGCLADVGAVQAIGGLSALVGLPGAGSIGHWRNYAQYNNHFKYLPNQSTNNDFRFTPITDNGFRRQVASESKE